MSGIFRQQFQENRYFPKTRPDFPKTRPDPDIMVNQPDLI